MSNVDRDEQQSPPHRNLGMTTRTQWALAGVTVVLIWWLWPSSKTELHTIDAPRTNWHGFLALRYGGIGATSGEEIMPTSRFYRHMHALIDAGYQLISLDDALRFAVDRGPLPE